MMLAVILDNAGLPKDYLSAQRFLTLSFAHKKTLPKVYFTLEEAYKYQANDITVELLTFADIEKEFKYYLTHSFAYTGLLNQLPINNPKLLYGKYSIQPQITDALIYTNEEVQNQWSHWLSRYTLTYLTKHNQKDKS